MRFAFATCVQLGLSCIKEIYELGGRLDLVITLPDSLAKDKSGRVYLDAFCKENTVDLLKVRNINEPEVIQALHDYHIDWLFIIGWSQIAKAAVLEAPRSGVLGMHPTLLPQGRGRAAIPWAILKGLTVTGVTLFKLDEGVDTGPILAQERLLIAPDETATTLYERVAEAHRVLMRKVWPDLLASRLELVAQDDTNATEWPGRTPEDGRILPDMTVVQVDRLVRATTRPYPGAFWVEGDKVIRIWRGVKGDSPQTAPEGAYRLCLADGHYDALDYQYENGTNP